MKRKGRILLLNILLGVLNLFIFSCGNFTGNQALDVRVAGEDTLYVCDFKKLGDVVDVPLSDWVTDFQYIQLGNSDASLMRGIGVYITDNYIGVLDHQAFKLFNQKGDYLCDVGKFGQGPGEYSHLYSAAMNEAANRICLMTFSDERIWIYDFNGQFIESHRVQHLAKGVGAYEENGSLTVTHMHFNPNAFQYLQIDSDGLQTYAYDEDLKVVSRNLDGNFMAFNYEVYAGNNTPFFTFHITERDTLYRFNAHELQTERRFALQNFQGLPLGIRLTETSSAFWVHFYEAAMKEYKGWTPPSNTVIVEKQNQKAYFVAVKNDFVGGLPVSHLGASHGGWYYEIFEPLQLLEMIDERMEASDCTEEDRKALEKLRSSFHEDSNNILFMGKLKM